MFALKFLLNCVLCGSWLHSRRNSFPIVHSRSIVLPLPAFVCVDIVSSQAWCRSFARSVYMAVNARVTCMYWCVPMLPIVSLCGREKGPSPLRLMVFFYHTFLYHFGSRLQLHRITSLSSSRGFFSYVTGDCSVPTKFLSGRV